MLLPTPSETELRSLGAPKWNILRENKAARGKGASSGAGVDPSTDPTTPPESYQEERARSDSAPGARGLPGKYDDNDLLSWVHFAGHGFTTEATTSHLVLS